MGYYQDLDEYFFISEEQEINNMCYFNKCEECNLFYSCAKFSKPQKKDFYLVFYRGLFLMSRPINKKIFNKDKNKARKFRNIDTAVKFMERMGIKNYVII